MALRKFNYLDRQRITRDDVILSYQNLGGRQRLRVSAQLEQYKFPPNAEVFLAARRIEIRRFNLGPVGAGRLEREVEIGPIGDDSGALSLVVLDPKSARKLGEATGLRPENAGAPGRSPLSLLPVDGSRKLDGEPWRIEYSEADGDGKQDAPVLLIDRELCAGVPASFLNNPMVAPLVFPSVLQQILTRILFVQGLDFNPAGLNWSDAWLRMGGVMSGQSCDEAGTSPEDKEDWIREVVAAFARSRDFVGTLREQGAQ